MARQYQIGSLLGNPERASKGFAALALASAIASGANAQDRRRVTEPVIPVTCRTLTAALSAVNGNTTLRSADEQKTDTERIQQAIDHCAPGQAVELAADGEANAFVSGPLHLRSGVSLAIDGKTILFASRNPRDYDVSPGSCGVVNHEGHGCKALINADHADNTGIFGGGTIDGRGGEELLGQKVSWWELAEEARGDDLRQNCPRIVQAVRSNHFTLYRVRLKNSPNFHVAYSGGEGFTAWGVIIDTPKKARNTDGIDPISARDVTITRCFIHAGDDNVAIKAGNSGPSAHISVTHNHFYTGHGISIGSETNGGVSAVRVTDLSIDGADNGIRIKSNSSRGGLVHDVVYQDVCIRNTKNPVLLDTHYSFYGQARNLLPVFKDIVLRDVRVEGGGKVTLEGYDAAHRLGVRFDNVLLEPAQLIRLFAAHADILLGPGAANFQPSGEDVKISGKAGQAAPTSCAGKFVPLPAE